MNTVQKLIVSLFCFILGILLIYGAYLEGMHLAIISGSYFPELWLPWQFLRDIKLYLGIISIGASFFFLFKEVKHG